MRPIDADDLLKQKPFTYTRQELNYYCEGFADCAQEARETISKMPTLTPPNEWVSVEERLPEPDFPGQQRGFYLVALSNGTVKELMYEFRHYENMMFDVGWHETAYPITHWMPLPAPPDRRPPKREE